MKSRQSRKLLALTAMMCGISSAFTNGGEENEWWNRIHRVMNGRNGMQKMLPDENYCAKDKKQKENDHILQYLSYMELNNNCINHSFGKRSVDNKRRLPALPDEDYYKSSKACVNSMPKISTSKRWKNKKLSLDYLMRSASLKDNRVLNSADKKFYNEKCYNEFRSAFLNLIQIFETTKSSQIRYDEVASLMEKMRTAVDNVNWDMPIIIRNGSNLFIPLNLYVFELNKKDGCYHPCSKEEKEEKEETEKTEETEETCNDDCFLYAKFTLPEDWIKKFDDIRISSIDKIDYRSPGEVCATFTLISNGLEEYKNLRGELKGDIMIGHYTWFDLPKDQKTRYNLPCYSKIK